MQGLLHSTVTPVMGNQMDRKLRALGVPEFFGAQADPRALKRSEEDCEGPYSGLRRDCFGELPRVSAFGALRFGLWAVLHLGFRFAGLKTSACLEVYPRMAPKTLVLCSQSQNNHHYCCYIRILECMIPALNPKPLRDKI